VSGVRFLSRGRVYSAQQLAALAAVPPLTGAQVEAGTPGPTAEGPDVIAADDLADICPVSLR
jgi:uncharacterized protein